MRQCCQGLGAQADFEALEPRALLAFTFGASPPIVLGTGADPQTMGVADLDGDGLRDIYGSFDAFAQPSSTYWRRNNGDGTLAASIQLGAIGGRIVHGDFDGDGDPDLIVRDLMRVAWFENVGMGTFAPARTVPGIPTGELLLAATDVDRDGRIELVMASGQSVKVYRDSNGVFVPTTYAVAFQPYSARVVDIDGDGPDDLVVSPNPSPVATPSAYFVGQAGHFEVSPAPSTVTIALLTDLNGDGKVDQMFAIGGELLTALGNGDGTFQPQVARLRAPAFPTSALSVLALDDFTGDGIADVLVGVQSFDSVTLSAIQGLGGGRFSESANHALAFFREDVDRAVLLDRKTDGPATVVVRTLNHQLNQTHTGRVRLATAVVGSTVQLQIPTTYRTGALPLAAAVSPPPTGWTTTRVDYYLGDASGKVDLTLAPFASASAAGSDGLWRTETQAAFLQQFGTKTIFAIATQTNGSATLRSEPVSASVVVWLRQFYAGGLRNDTTNHETVALLNPSASPIAYLIIARYETGRRDKLIAEGSLAPGARRLVVLTDPAHPGTAAVRRGVAYALEIQSEGLIAATFTRLVTGTDSAAASQPFSTEQAGTWVLPEVRRGRGDRLAFYNPGVTAATVTVSLAQRNGVTPQRVLTLEPFRSAWVDIATFPGFSRDAARVSVSSTASIVASAAIADAGVLHSSPLNIPGTVAVIPHFELRAGLGNWLLLSGSGTASLAVGFGGESTLVTRLFTLGATATLRIKLDDLAPSGASRGYVRIETSSSVAIHGYAEDLSRGDTTLLPMSRSASTQWGFSDVRLRPGAAGTQDKATVAVYNPGTTSTRVQFTVELADGRTHTLSRRVAAGSTGVVWLHGLPALRQRPGRFGLVVSSPSPIVATITEWRGSQGGWSSLGAVLAGTAGFSFSQ